MAHFRKNGCHGSTTGQSAPVRCLGTFGLTGLPLAPFPFPSSTRFSSPAPEPQSSSRRLYAGDHPGSKQVAPRFIPKVAKAFGFDLVHTVSTLHQRFTRVRLLDRHMTRSSRAFSITLTTLAFDQRGLWLFEACSCKPTSEGLPPSLAQHRV